MWFYSHWHQEAEGISLLLNSGTFLRFALAKKKRKKRKKNHQKYAAELRWNFFKPRPPGTPPVPSLCSTSVQVSLRTRLAKLARNGKMAWGTAKLVIDPQNLLPEWPEPITVLDWTLGRQEEEPPAWPLDSGQRWMLPVLNHWIQEWLSIANRYSISFSCYTVKWRTSLLLNVYLIGCSCCWVTQSWLTLCDPVDGSTPGFPVLHHLRELAQTHVHCVCDGIQPSPPLPSPSPFAFNLPQHQDNACQILALTHRVGTPPYQPLKLYKQFSFWGWVMCWRAITALPEISVRYKSRFSIWPKSWTPKCSVLSDSLGPRTVAHQAPLSMEFSSQEYWSGLPFPPPGDLPDPGIKPRSPASQADSLPPEPPGKL